MGKWDERPGGVGGGDPEPAELPQLPPQAQQEMGRLWEGKWGGGVGQDCGMWEWAGPPTQHRAVQEAQEKGPRFSALSNLSGFEGPWRSLTPNFQPLTSSPYGETEALRSKDIYPGFLTEPVQEGDS